MLCFYKRGELSSSKVSEIEAPTEQEQDVGTDIKQV